MIDPGNKFFVSAINNHVVIQRPPNLPITKRDALVLAAWLVAIAQEEKGEFQEILNTVLST